MNQIIDKGIATFTITSQPFYDQFSQCYKNILMVNFEPRGPIRKFIRRIKLPKLSPFQTEGNCNYFSQCGLAIQSLRGTNFGLNNFQYTGCCKISSSCDLMTPDEIPNLISFLLSNGYQIESQFTNMMNLSEIKLNNSKIVFIVTYFGSNNANITYMR